MTQEPWYLTGIVVRTEGIQFVRPDKSWRPRVAVSLVGTAHCHSTDLGCDGQNPNLKVPFILHDVDYHTKLDIKVWHHARTKKKGRKPHLIGSAYVTLGELQRRQENPDANVIVSLKCPPSQKRSPAVGSRQSNIASLTVRLRTPSTSPSISSEATLVGSEDDSVRDEGVPDDGVASDASKSTSRRCDTPEDIPDILPAAGASGLKRRRKRSKLKPYSLDTDDEAGSSSSSCSSRPCTPFPQEDNYTYSYDGDADTSFEVISQGPMCYGDDLDSCCPAILPHYSTETLEVYRPSAVEWMLDSFAPYHEMSDPSCDFSRVLTRLTTEWYAVGGCLLATAALNAAVFGYSTPTLVDIDSIAMKAVTVGAIASGIGLVADVWFLVVYNGSDAAKFQRLAQDLYGTYFFFCLTCRLPMLCLFAAVCSLLVFLLAVAQGAWSTAVLVMCCAAGVLLTLQYLVYGAHRTINFALWLVWRTGRACGALFRRTATPPATDQPPAGQAMTQTALSAS
ncbi:hypothetical protein PsYK624_140430 [Phanerochaete sordida]|uniref:C2 domain-containing protein n=1 Tax=Phanerochaete sordida TaxID=48140 RepID=A0A9P3GMN9_9APHY|nr:hypothetical protein PsYK624_140430 [Phanerochaete sordida]